jgi:hypothetical protein
MVKNKYMIDEGFVLLNWIKREKMDLGADIKVMREDPTIN